VLIVCINRIHDVSV